MCTDGTEICENTGPEKATTNKICEDIRCGSRIREK